MGDLTPREVSRMILDPRLTWSTAAPIEIDDSVGDFTLDMVMQSASFSEVVTAFVNQMDTPVPMVWLTFRPNDNHTMDLALGYYEEHT